MDSHIRRRDVRTWCGRFGKDRMGSVNDWASSHMDDYFVRKIAEATVREDSQKKAGEFPSQESERKRSDGQEPRNLTEVLSERNGEESGEASEDESGVPSEKESRAEPYAEILQRSSPFDIPDLENLLRGEIGRVSSEVPENSWGALCLTQTSRILKTAKPATMYIKDVPPGVRSGLYVTSLREEADVLSLDNEAARDALADGPPDGKRILIRGSNDRRGLQVARLLTHIERYRMSDLDVQDPTISANNASFRGMAVAEVTCKLRQVLNGTKTVGYGIDQVPPYNLLSLPSFCPGEPLCLSKTEATSIHRILRTMNHVAGYPAPEDTSWTILAVHLAISLPHQDHDGLGTLLHGFSGYKILIFWPKMTQVDRSKFLKEGIYYCGRGARYLVLGPHDEYVQTPCVSQDVHSVISVGYCGVSTCLENCVKNGHPRCYGVIGMAGTHYWHAHYMDDSVRSATDELESSLATNQEPHLDFTQQLERLTLVAERDPTILGGVEACQRFTAAKMDYLRKAATCS